MRRRNNLEKIFRIFQTSLDFWLKSSDKVLEAKSDLDFEMLTYLASTSYFINKTLDYNVVLDEQDKTLRLVAPKPYFSPYDLPKSELRDLLTQTFAHRTELREGQIRPEEERPDEPLIGVSSCWHKLKSNSNVKPKKEKEDPVLPTLEEDIDLILSKDIDKIFKYFPVPDDKKDQCVTSEDKKRLITYWIAMWCRAAHCFYQDARLDGTGKKSCFRGLFASMGLIGHVISCNRLNHMHVQEQLYMFMEHIPNFIRHDQYFSLAPTNGSVYHHQDERIVRYMSKLNNYGAYGLAEVLRQRADPEHYSFEEDAGGKYLKLLNGDKIYSSLMHSSNNIEEGKALGKEDLVRAHAVLTFDQRDKIIHLFETYVDLKNAGSSLARHGLDIRDIPLGYLLYLRTIQFGSLDNQTKKVFVRDCVKKSGFPESMRISTTNDDYRKGIYMLMTLSEKILKELKPTQDVIDDFNLETIDLQQLCESWNDREKLVKYCSTYTFMPNNQSLNMGMSLEQMQTRIKKVHRIRAIDPEEKTISFVFEKEGTTMQDICRAHHQMFGNVAPFEPKSLRLFNSRMLKAFYKAYYGVYHEN